VIAVQNPVEALNTEAERLVGTPVNSPFEITSVLNAQSTIGRMTEFFLSELEHDDGLFQRSNLASQEFQRAFITAMIESTENTHEPALEKPKVISSPAISHLNPSRRRNCRLLIRITVETGAAALGSHL
jgi:hypothetical protein